MNLPIRYRIALTLSLALAAFAAVFAYLLMHVARQQVLTELDRRLEIEAYVTADLIRLSTAEALQKLQLRDLIESEELESSERSIDLEVRQGAALIYRRPSEVSTAFLRHVEFDPKSSGAATWRLGHDEIRVLQLKFEHSSATWFIRVAVSERESLEELSSWQIGILIASPLVLAFMVLLSYYLAGRALEPLVSITSQIGSISANNLGHRIPVPATADEIARLAVGFNELLARLNDAFAEMKRFTSDASHQLRTPLTVIQAIGEFAMSYRMTSEEYCATIGHMLEELARLTNLAEALLMLARAEIDSPPAFLDEVVPRDLVEAICAQLRPLTEERRQLLSVQDSITPSILTDANQVQLAIMNVIHNAIKFTPDGGCIDIGINCLDSNIVITVDDTGPGIAVSEREKIFDRFYRSDGPRSAGRAGFGLGLSIARAAIVKLGGTIFAGESASGGARISIILPPKERFLL